MSLPVRSGQSVSEKNLSEPKTPAMHKKTALFTGAAIIFNDGLVPDFLKNTVINSCMNIKTTEPVPAERLAGVIAQ